MHPHVIVCDLGRIRAFRVQPAGPDPEQQTHLVEIEIDGSDLRRQRLQEVVSDQAGGFPRGGPAGRRGGMSRGEEHQLEQELERQGIERLADRIDEVLEQAGYPAWRLVAPVTIVHRLREILPSPVLGTLSRVEVGDLTGMPVARLEKVLI